MKRRHLLVANPTAQSGRAQRWIGETLEKLADRDIPVVQLDTLPNGKTIEAVQARIDEGDIDVVISLGGDGTFHEVARGILAARERKPMGMLPSGTANDQGRSFGIERGQIERNLNIIAAGHITELDVGRIERLDDFGNVTDTTLFFDSCGWGLQSEILAARNRTRATVDRIPLLRELYRDKMIYIGASVNKLLESYVTRVKFAAEILADGVKHEVSGMTDVIINATPIYAGSWVLDRNSEPDDGKFEFIPMQGRRDWASKALRDLAASPVWQEQLDPLGISHSKGFSAQQFEIELFRPEKGGLHAQVDGEEWITGNRYRVTVLPNQLPLITDADFVPPWRPNN